MHERTGEIGLIKALGASDRQVMLLFLAEAGGLSLAGGMAGISLGVGLGAFLAAAIPGFWIETPMWSLPLALAVSLAVGVVAGSVPALRAARLNPVDALRAE
ncbi:MAG: ABC transporter permease [Planctomycetes bacterium]|nr:ABC transporter permease [Planctomycetota bacterium]